MTRLSKPKPMGKIAALALALMASQAQLASSSALMVTPVSVNLGPKVPSALLTVTNLDDREVHFEVSMFAWAQSENGGTVLSPTEDLVVFPLLYAIAPHEERVLRVQAAKNDSTLRERSYRVLIEELATPRSEGDAGTVMITMNFSIPVFVAAARPSARAMLETPTVDAGRMRFRLVNAGNTHIHLQAVTVRFENSDGMASGEQQLTAWYLLAGQTRAFDVPLDPKLCGTATSIVVEAKWADARVSARAPLWADACN